MEDDFTPPRPGSPLRPRASADSERDRVAQGTAAANGFVTGVRELVTLAQVWDCSSCKARLRP